MTATRTTRGDRWPPALALLGAIGAWSIAVPYVGPELGLTLAVSGTVEVVDHVVPGALVVACSLVARSILRRGRSGGPGALGCAGAIALAGLWITATHVPLLVDAGRGVVPWGTACFHAVSGPPLLGLGLALLLHELRTTQP